MLTGPRRGTFLEERAQARLAFLAYPDLGDAALGRRAVRSFEHELLRLARRLRACAPQLAEQPLDGCVQSLGDLVDEPDPPRGLGVEAIPGGGVAPRGARADLGERERGDDRGDDPQLDLREREL